MRNSIELENGTVLEVGKKYRQHDEEYWQKIKYINSEEGWIVAEEEEDGYLSVQYPLPNWKLLPYEEPKTEKWVEYLNKRGICDFYHKCYIKLRDIEELDSYDTIIIREWDSKEQMIEDLKKG